MGSVGDGESYRAGVAAFTLLICDIKGLAPQSSVPAICAPRMQEFRHERNLQSNPRYHGCHTRFPSELIRPL
jgi:hypothetical protein